MEWPSRWFLFCGARIQEGILFRKGKLSKGGQQQGWVGRKRQFQTDSFPRQILQKAGKQSFFSSPQKDHSPSVSLI